MEPPRSADELLASTLRTGDVVVFNRYCRSLAPHRAALCLASKYGLSGDGRGCWDHAALVVRDRRTDVAYLLEGGAGAVTMRTYEERMGEFADATEAVLVMFLFRWLVGRDAKKDGAVVKTDGKGASEVL